MRTKNRAYGLETGKAPLPPSPQPWRVKQFVDLASLLGEGVDGWRWPGGMALTLLAVTLHSTPPDIQAPSSTAAVAPNSPMGRTAAPLRSTDARRL